MPQDSRGTLLKELLSGPVGQARGICFELMARKTTARLGPAPSSPPQGYAQFSLDKLASEQPEIIAFSGMGP